MSPAEYWDSDPRIASAYYEAELCRSHRRNKELWYSGIYFRRAVASVLSDETDYFEEPLPLSVEEADEQEERKRQRDLSAAKARFAAWADSKEGGQPR